MRTGSYDELLLGFKTAVLINFFGEWVHGLTIPINAFVKFSGFLASNNEES